MKLVPKSRRPDSPPFPWRQMIILGICRICEPIAFMSIFPYIYYMIKSFHITEDDKKIALYAGLVTSAFALAECLAGPVWGRLSDKYGRKPILLTGLAGTGISVLVFGFAQDLPTALVARALGGLLNGNIGVLQTTVAEVVNSEQNQARCYAMMPFVWCLGAIVGSALGGALVDPVSNYPSLFHAGTIFERYPYLLVNLVCAAVVAFSFSVGVFFLEETHEDKRAQRDVGVEMGNRIATRAAEAVWRVTRRSQNIFCREKSSEDMVCHLPDHEDEVDTLLLSEELPPPGYSSTASSPGLLPSLDVGDLPPAYQSVEGSPRNSLEPLDRSIHPGDLEAMQERDRKREAGLATAFTKQVVYNIAGFGILAYHTISAEQLLPVLFSLPESDTPASLPFRFTGGFALSTKTIGAILAVQGFVQMFATLVFFPFINRRLGTLWTYRLVVLMYPLLYVMVPYLTLVPINWRLPAIAVVMTWKVTAQALAFPSSNIMLANAAPTKRVLGTLNGVASSAASGFRAFGPTISGILQSAGLSFGALGLPWWVTAIVASCGALLSLLMVEEKRPRAVQEKVRDADTESIPDSPAIEAAVPDHAQVAAETFNASSGGLMSTPGSPILSRKSFCSGIRHSRL